MNKNFLNIIPGEKGSATLLLYGNVGEEQVVDSARVVTELANMEKSYNKIDVRINSKGGEVFSGMAIYNALRQSKADITIYVDGLAASIAAIIALCGKPLYMSPYAKLMLHSVSGGAFGNASELRIMAEQMERIEDDLANMIAGRVGMEAKGIKDKYFDGKDHWINAADAVAMKLADGIYKMDVEENPQSEEDIYNFFNSYTLRGGIKNQNEMALIDDIKGVPSFADVAEADIVAHIKDLENKATKADSLEKANAALQNRMAEMQKKEVEVFLDQAVKDGKIKAEQKEHFAKLMASDRETTETLINSMVAAAKPAARAALFINQGDAPTGLESKSWDELDKENQLANLKAQDKALFAAKFKEKFGVDYQE